MTARISGYDVLAGTSKEPGLGLNFVVVAFQNGTRELYWNDGLKSGLDRGTHRISKDKISVTREESFEGKEQFYEVFKLADGRYESWLEGRLVFSYYKLR